MLSARFVWRAIAYRTREVPSFEMHQWSAGTAAGQVALMERAGVSAHTY